MTPPTPASTPTSRLLQGALVAALLAPSGSAMAVDPAATAASVPASAGLLEPITTLIGDAECDNPGQCRAVGIGAKACGGPSSYLAWSSKRTDAAALQLAVAAHAQAQRQEDARRGLTSDCMISPEPTAVCRPRASDGKTTCQLGRGGVRSAI